MAMFSAYFDASGHPDNTDVLTVAGYAAAIENWIKFENEWKEILSSEGVVAFHTTDFVSGLGEFVGWGGKEPEKVERRKRFIQQLMDCTDKLCAKFFRISVYLRDYDRVNAEFKLEEAIGKPYALCGSSAANLLRLWAKDLGVLDTLLYYFENGDKDKGDLIRIHKRAFGREPKFLEKDEAKAFEAADFNAWKMRALLEQSGKPTHTIEKGMRLLDSLAVLAGVQKDGGVFNEWSFREFCRIYGIEKR
jgi:hypothetical protein